MLSPIAGIAFSFPDNGINLCWAGLRLCGDFSPQSWHLRMMLSLNPKHIPFATDYLLAVLILQQRHPVPTTHALMYVPLLTMKLSASVL